MDINVESFSKNLLDKLEQLKCPICLDIVDKTRELPCKHVFCSNCLETYKKEKNAIVCPLCKKALSKRKILSRDAALDSLCSFVRALGEDIKVHHKTDLKTFFSRVPKGPILPNFTNRNESLDFIPQSSDEIMKPSTSKKDYVKKSCRKRNLNESKFSIETAPKPNKLDIKKSSLTEKKTKTKPKIGLSRKQNKAKIDDSAITLKPKHVHQNELPHKPSENKKILQWLHDTRNQFERFSQTQPHITEKDTQQDIDMPSVSQIYMNKRRLGKISKEVQKDQVKISKDQNITKRKAQSIGNSPQNKLKSIRRHSLECTSPVKMKQYENLHQLNSIENQLIIDIMEKEVLDVIDKEISGGKNKIPDFSSEQNIHIYNPKVTNTDEDKFLDQLENEMSERSSDIKKDSPVQKSLNRTETNQENKSKSSWKSIRKFRKTIGKKKVPKKLDISLLSTQKSNKKDVGTKINTSDPLVNIDKTVTVGKTVDFQKMEEYFSTAIPKMIEKNMVETSSQEIVNDKDMYQKDSEANQVGKDNDSDIYVYQTQPLSEEMVDPKTDKISYAARLTKQLETILQQLTKDEGIQMNELSSLYPSIESIFKIFDKLKDKKAHQSQISPESKKQRKFSEKHIQTDMLSLDGFTITPNAAFKSLIHEDVATQTNNFCLDCPHFSSGKKNSTPTPSSSLMMDIDSQRNVENGKNSKSKKPSQSMLNQEYSVSKSQLEIANLQKKSPSLNDINFEKQISVNESMNKGHNDSEIVVGKILELCNTQNNVSFIQPTIKKTPNRSQMSINHSSSRPKNNSNESRSNSRVGNDTSQGSGIMCSVPQSRVNRRLMFEKAMKERTELEQNLKRMRTVDSTSDSDEERPYKVKCNRFVQNDLSIEFDSESLHDNSQCSRYCDVEMEEAHEEHPGVEKKSVFHENSENIQPKTKHSYENTQADTLLNYCDELIEKANKHILEEDLLSEQKDFNLSQILSENDKKNISNHERLNQSVTERQVKTQQDIEKIKTQDLLKHYDELIEKASRQIETENDDRHTQKVRNTNIKSPITSKHTDCLEEEQNLETKIKLIKTQELLDDCNILIGNATEEIGRNEMSSSHKDSNTRSQNDDEFFCQNLDQLDNVLEKENIRAVLSRDKFSESLFGSCKENSIYQTSSVENKITESNNLLCTPKRKSSVKEHNIGRKKENAAKGNGENSDEEIFSDADVVDTTPQKSVSFIERLSCSQIVNQNFKISLHIQEDTENIPASINIVPPPPGFDDEIPIEEKVNSEPNIQNSERESESVIPNSISPQKFEVPSKRKPLVAANVNTVKFAVPQEMTTLSQQFMKVSPICKEKSKNLNVIEMVRQSKFSPLTIVPKTNTSVLTSTPKQKSILSYVKSKISQEESTSTSQKPKPCIAFTRLNNAETLCVHSLCNRNLVTRQDKFGPEVTHMIVSVDKHNNVKDHTIKFISAIAAGIWVVNIKWVQECLSQNCIVNEEPFEVLDITGIPSPRISRLTRVVNPLLKGFKFYIPRSFAQTSAEDVKNIIQLLQGVVVSSIEEFKDRGEYTCIIISELVDTEDYNQYEDWLSSYKILTVDINWLSLSVSRYKILSLRPHLLCSDDSIDELGYPSDLVVDVPTSLTQDVTYD
ncbi:uncharacterized protein LOC123312253 isoform X2 [Coccinella septempunctata]|uniref:uncharacterized protein LOC123312253 isoform X2 n=1 Tax=Coccinella septempunctata TaxID=41139 RepID=UPI001D06A377|nr:uncharacterized protein LOC123312253 isoform X2 [Coccinella septempunctata]